VEKERGPRAAGFHPPDLASIRFAVFLLLSPEDFCSQSETQRLHSM